MAPFTQKTPTLALALAAALYGYRLAAGRLNSASLSVSTKVQRAKIDHGD